MDDVQRAQHLISTHSKLAGQIFDDAVERGMINPVVALLDLADPGAKKIAIHLAGQEAVEKRLKDTRLNKSDPALLCAWDADDACDFLKREPGASEILREFITQRKLPIILVTCGQFIVAGGKNLS